MMDEINPVSSLIDRAIQKYRYADYQGGINALKEALGIEPDNGYLHSALSAGLLNTKRLHAASYEANIGLQLEPNSPYSHFMMGRVLRAQQKYKAAIYHFQQAIALAPDDSDYHVALAVTYKLKGNKADAKQELDKALQLSPDDPAVHSELGDWHYAQGDMKRAQAAYSEALASEPQHIDALIGMGFICLDRGDVEQAYDHAIWVLQQHASHEGALRLLSNIKARKNIFLGLWWRFNSWSTAGGSARMILILLSAYTLFRVATIVLGDMGYATASTAVSNIWIGIVVYTWVGPVWFNNLLKKELETVKLDSKF